MKKIFLAGLGLCVFLIFWVVYIPYFDVKNQYEPKNIGKFFPITDQSILKKINCNIHTIMADIEVVTGYKNHYPVKLHGKLYYDNNKIRVILASLFSSHEVDIGCNDKQVWYYARKLELPRFYYIDRDKLHTAQLKNSFNPLVINELLFMQNSKFDFFCEENNLTYLLVYEQDHNLQKIQKICVFDKDKQKIIGNYIYNEKNELVASSEIHEWQGEYPYRVAINYPLERIRIMYIWKTLKINNAIDENIWVLPNYN